MKDQGAAMRGLARLAAAAVWLLAATAGLPATASPAIPEVPTLRHIGVADGLPSSEVKDLAFDPDGYLWIATVDGLARYDGVGMQVWRHVPGDPGSLPGNYMTVLHVDPQGRVWVAPESRGLSVLDGARDGFRHYRKADHPQMGSDDVWAITSHDDALWFGTFGGGLHRLDEGGDGRGGEAITRFMPREGDPRSLPSDIVLSLGVDSQDRLWAGTTGGLARWTGSDFERVALPGDAAAPAIFSVTPLGDDLWIGASSGVFRRGPDGTWHRPEWAAMFKAPGNMVFGMLAEPDGGLWLASSRQLWRVSPGAVPVPVPIGAKGPVLPMFQILRQPNGAMWFPVPGVGLGYLQPDWRRIAQFDHEHHGLSSEFYRGIAVARDGGTWLLGARGELERLDADGTVFPIRQEAQDQLAGPQGMSVLENAGRLWVGQRKRLSRIDLETGAVQRWDVGGAVDPPLDGAPHLQVRAPDGAVWLSFSGAGLQRRDPASGAVLETILPGPRQGLGIGDVEAMAFDRHGVLWIADGRGMRRWDADAGMFVAAAGMEIADRVFAFAFDRGGGLWLQHLAGIEHYRRVGDRWRRDARVGVEQGIPALEGAGLEIDHHGRVWLSSRRGLFRWDPASDQLRRFGLADGLGSQEFVDRALTITDAGVLAATLADGGVVMIDTLAPDPPPLQPALHVDRVEVRRDGRWVALAGDDAALRLAPDDREMRVQLRLLSYDDPRANRYFTRLDGYDSGWIDQGASGERVFAGLPAGDYTLRARAVDAAGNAAAEQLLGFRVLPPWWRTPWALAGFIGLLALLSWWAVNEYRERLLRRQALHRAEHEHEVAREASLAKTRFLATLGHEVRTPMTGVLGMSELLLGTRLDSLQRGYTESIRGAGEHLLRLVNDALDLARIESGKLELSEQPFDLRMLVDEVAALMAPLAKARGLAFVVEFDAHAPAGLLGDAVRLRQILLNLLGNAIKFTESGSVTLGVAREEGQGVRLRVADTGPGLNAEQQARLFRRFEQAEGARTAARYGGSGLGLAICQELAAAMGGTIRIDSAPGAGSRFDVSLPLADAVVPHAVALEAERDAMPPLSLLLVEDDPIVAGVVSGLLQAQGHHVRHAGHGLAALAEVATGRFDAALLDLDLPGMDGLALAQHLRGQGFEARLVAITARADADAEPQAMAAGFDRFLRKPVTGAMLRRILDDAPQPVD